MDKRSFSQFLNKGKAMIRKKNGFTMFDILMVITVILIFSVIAIPRLTSYNSMKLYSVANKLAMDIKYTQQLAISKQKHCGLSFNTGNENYFVYINAPTNKATDPFSRGDLIVDYQTNPYYKGVDLVSTNFGDKLIFNQVGKPHDGTGDALYTDGQIILQSPGESLTILVTRGTGKVSIQ